MPRKEPLSPGDFFTSTAARKAGLTDEFWLEAYKLFIEEARRGLNPRGNPFHVERTFRVPFREGHVDVLVRSQPEPREWMILRFTAFPSADEREVQQVDRFYMSCESRPALGEAVLPDAGWRW